MSFSLSLPNSPSKPTNDENKTRHLTPENDLNLAPFISQRLNQWHTNEEVFKILKQCNLLSSLENKSSYYKQLKEERFSQQAVRMPKNGSVFVFDRRQVKNYKKDFFLWKRRKTGSSKSVREDRMSLKVNGVESIYGCYSHSYLMPTFHRRIYWLLGKPDIVLVHYLQIPNNESGECLLSINLKNSDYQFSEKDVSDQLESMIWPYFLNQEFVLDNFKLNSLTFSNENDLKSNFIHSISNCLFESKTIRINFSRFFKNLTTNNQNQTDLLNENKSNELKNSKFENHEKFSTNQVKLSLDHCSSEGGERLMLVSDWKGDQYQMIINEKILNLNKLNTHVLEVILPKFDSQNLVNSKTLIYIFENQQLFCEPIPFEIKNNSVNSDDFKNKFYLLERILMLYKYYRLNSIDGESLNAQETQLIVPISFEQRMCQMLESLINHLSVNNIHNSLTRAQYVFNNEHEGKTLLNLCIDANYLNIFKCLERFISLINLKKDLDLSLLKNELDLFTLDHHGINPLILVCRNGNQLIANEVFRWIENDLIKETSSQVVSSWIYSLLKSKEEASKHSHTLLVNQLDDLLEKAQTKLNNLNNLSNVFDLNLIDNFDLSSLLENNESSNNLFPTIELDNVVVDSDLTNLINEADLVVEDSFESVQLIDSKDDQDDKIKTLADNIIAAMPHKIKINNYTQQNDNEFILESNKTVLLRNAVSFDENYITDLNETSIDGYTNFSSNRSSLSLSSSQSLQFSHEIQQVKESSPDDNSTTSSFHIDSPPSTAEFCQYFHAGSSSRCSIETGFAQLTLTDAEQRELYEAALVIQNAYRRYMKRKKKRFKHDLVTKPKIYFNLDECEKNSNIFSIETCSTNSLFNTNSANEINLMQDFHVQNYENVMPNNSSHEIVNQQKQFEAACTIQKYYRRYKQYEKLQNEAASRIQKRYRAYKMNGYRKMNATNKINSFHHSSIDEASTETSQFVYSDELPLNQKLIQRKIVNIRQNSRFSPSSPALSPSVINRIGSDNCSNVEDFNFNKQLTQFETNINNFISVNRIESNELFNNR